MDRRTLIAIVLCFGIFLGWQKLYIEPRMPKPAPVAEKTAPTTTAASPQSAVSAPTAPVVPTKSAPSKPSQTLTLKTGTGEATLGDGGKFFVSWTLKDYYQGLSIDTGAIDLKIVTQQASQMELAFDDPALSYLSTAQGELKKTPNGASWVFEDSNVKMERVFSIPEGQNYVDVQLNLLFKSKQPRYAFVSLSGTKMAGKDPEEVDRQLLYFTERSLERVHLTDAVPLREVGTPVKYIGSQNRYFLFSLVNQSPIEARGLLQPTQDGVGRMNFVYPITGNTLSIPLKAYFGPKALPILRSVDPALDHTVDFGWFTPIAYPLLAILRWFYQFVQNYGVAIILLTVLLKIVTYPLTYKSMKSMKEMARLQPQIEKLKAKHGNDKEALNREMLGLMKNHGYNPMAGCLPILVQMPVFFALYRVLYSSIELYHAPFILWIHDLSAHDPYYVTPVLMSLTMFIQQKLSPTTATDPIQQKMLLFMPLIFGAFMLTLPSGLTLYMLVNALVSIVQQIIMNKKLDLGHAPAPAANTR